MVPATKMGTRIAAGHDEVIIISIKLIRAVAFMRQLFCNIHNRAWSLSILQFRIACPPSTSELSVK